MCFKKPKPPKVDTSADADLYAQRVQAEQDNAVVKAEAKRIRTEDQLALLQGKIGRKSLFTGGQGGRGYPGARSLFGNVTSYAPGRVPLVNPGPPGGFSGGGGGSGTAGSGGSAGSGGGSGGGGGAGVQRPPRGGYRSVFQ